ncbi:cation diffusion facilitator family transporter [Paracoccus onubensis]|uniref:cation diffusion facilitator family transporter n=1 Tax=Paracoccus onubensis TaxID=1675788 RepID=UPI00272F1A0B|nr:cation diffusion facilitator family transporter [Paracoccus onubensis]MDP0930000.1 cation diffusion facilitator family transporter [Paracoccus onubensis]
MSHSHSHDHHDHSHAPSVSSDNERKVLLSFFLIFTFMIVEVIGGLISGSLALLADAGHMLTDAAALALAYAAFRFGRRAPDARRTFGYLRFEVIAGFINAITLFAIVAWIVYEAWRRFQEPHAVLAGPMLGVAVAGLLINVLVFRILTRGDSEHVNIKGAALHVLGDLLGSVGAVMAAIVIYYTGWTPIDPILSVVVSLLILRSAWKLLVKSLHILLEGAPGDATPEKIAYHLKGEVPGVADVSHVHVWSITSGRMLATLHVRPAAGADIQQVVRAVERELQSQFRIEHATIALQWNDEVSSCSLSRTVPRAHAHCPHDHDHGPQEYAQ